MENEVRESPQDVHVLFQGCGFALTRLAKSHGRDLTVSEVGLVGGGDNAVHATMGQIVFLDCLPQ